MTPKGTFEVSLQHVPHEGVLISPGEGMESRRILAGKGGGLKRLAVLTSLNESVYIPAHLASGPAEEAWSVPLSAASGRAVLLTWVCLTFYSVLLFHVIPEPLFSATANPSLTH